MSHISTAVLFRMAGWRIYVEPPADLLALASDREALARQHGWAADQVFVRPDDPGQTPLYINWSSVVRVYPPGSSLLHAPLAWLYLKRVITIDQAAFGAVLGYALAALAASFLLAGIAVDSWNQARRPSLNGGVARALAVSVATAVCGSQLVLWGCEGFYDTTAVLCAMIACARYADRRWTAALLWYSVALSMHARMIWLAPLACACLWHRWFEWRTRRDARLLDVRASAAIAIGAASAVAITLMYAHIEPGVTWAIRSGVYPASPDYSGWLLATVEGVSVLAAGALWRQRDRLGATLVVTVGAMLPTLAQVQAWHSLALVPLVFHTALRPGWKPVTMGLVFYGLIARLVFDAHVVDVARLWRLAAIALS